MKIFIDITCLMHTEYLTGIQRTVKNVVAYWGEAHPQEMLLATWDVDRGKYRLVDSATYQPTKTFFDIADIGQGYVFFDLDSPWAERVKRSYLLPILKKQGAKIVVQIYDVLAVTHAQYCHEGVVMTVAEYVCAHLQHADLIIANAQATLDALATLCQDTGVTMPPGRVIPLGSDF